MTSLLPPPTANRRPRSRRGDPRRQPPLPVWLRRLRVEVLLWAFREGRPVDAAALTAVLGAKHARDTEPFDQWTRHTVRGLLWGEVAEWCEGLGLPAPAATAATMWTLLDHLAAHDRFDPGSDPLPALREPLVDSGGLDRRTGRPRRPSGRPSGRPAHPSRRGSAS